MAQADGSSAIHSRYFRWQMNHPLAPLSDMLVQQLFFGSDAFKRKDYYQNFITGCWCGNFNSSSTAEIDVPKLQRIELTYYQRYSAHRYDCGRTMDVHSQSASRSHSKSIACPPVETSRLIFSNTDDRGFNIELTNSRHGIAKNLCFESTLML